MRLSQWIWGFMLLATGILLATDALPGSDRFATGPRIGLTVALLTLGALVFLLPLTTWFLRKTTRPSDYQGSCPVGRVCPRCSAFNYNPRSTCRSCSSDLAAVPEAAREPL